MRWDTKSLSKNESDDKDCESVWVDYECATDYAVRRCLF